MLGYLRTILKTAFFKDKPEEVYLTKPKSIEYEIFVFEHYLRLMHLLLKFKERKTILEEDLKALND